MTDWRSIPMVAIDWSALKPHVGRNSHPLRRLTQGFPNRPPEPFQEGAWRNLTLGEVADLGRRALLRHNGMGEATLAALQYVIDLAAAGKCPLTTGPAHDALRPTEKEAVKEFLTPETP